MYSGWSGHAARVWYAKYRLPDWRQVRTEWQHLWAEWFARLADQYGRGIRYGEPPESGDPRAQEMVDRMISLGDELAQSEESGGAPPLSAVGLALAEMIIHWLRTHQPER